MCTGYRIFIDKDKVSESSRKIVQTGKKIQPRNPGKGVHRQEGAAEHPRDGDGLPGSVADPNPDPPVPRVFGPPGSGSGSFYH